MTILGAASGNSKLAIYLRKPARRITHRPNFTLDPAPAR